jgi:hypothetical protein
MSPVAEPLLVAAGDESSPHAAAGRPTRTNRTNRGISNRSRRGAGYGRCIGRTIVRN